MNNVFWSELTDRGVGISHEVARYIRLAALAVGGFQATARAAWRSAAVVTQYDIMIKAP